MSPYRRGRKDSTHKVIVAELEAHGLIVFDVSGVPGLGFDILCYQAGIAWEDVNSGETGVVKISRWQPFEIKSSKTVHHQKTALTPAEQKAAQRAPIPCIESAADALKYFVNNLSRVLVG